MWRANAKAWVSRKFLTEWMHDVFAPGVKIYLQVKGMPLKCFLLLDNMYTLNINQSNVPTKLKKHDFVIPEIEVTSQLIDLRSSATLC